MKQEDICIALCELFEFFFFFFMRMIWIFFFNHSFFFRCLVMVRQMGSLRGHCCWLGLSLSWGSLLPLWTWWLLSFPCKLTYMILCYCKILDIYSTNRPFSFIRTIKYIFYLFVKIFYHFTYLRHQISSLWCSTILSTLRFILCPF